MLVLTRKIGEVIQIGGDTEVTVQRVLSDGRVRIGVKAPDNIRIMRKEVLNRVDVIPAVHNNGDVPADHYDR
jgi:carbon storage regulator